MAPHKQRKVRRTRAEPRPNSVEAAAKALGVSPNTVRNEVARKRLKAVKLGKRLLIFPEHLAAYCAALPSAVLKENRRH